MQGFLSEPPPRACVIGIIASVLVAVAIRIAFLDFLTFDVTDFVLHWYERIAEAGYSALGENIPNVRGEVRGNYSPPYYYLLFVASWFRGVLPDLHLVKSISMTFDVVAAVFAFRIVAQRFRSGVAPWVAGTCVFVAPTVILNGAVWGQCDVVYASLILGALDFSLRGRHSVAAAMFGLAFAFKAPAIFFAPFFGVLALRSEMPWRALVYAPLVFTLAMLPAILLGRDPVEVFTVYLSQGAFFDQLSMNAPNLYHFVPNKYYASVTAIGIVVTAVATGILVLLPRFVRTPLTPEGRVLAATTFVALVPFLLPKMHDRYFFLADLIAIVLAFYVPRLWFIPLLFQLTSVTAYAPIIALGNDPDAAENTALTGFAAFVNAATVGLLVVLYIRMCVERLLAPASAIRQAAVMLASLAVTFAVWGTVHVVLDAGADRICEIGGLLQWFCGRDLPIDLRIADPNDRIAFVLLIICSYVCARYGAVRLGFLARHGRPAAPLAAE
jgi:Gpi18-like mannosyltransferase